MNEFIPLLILWCVWFNFVTDNWTKTDKHRLEANYFKQTGLSVPLYYVSI